MLCGIFHLVSRFSCNIADNSVNLHYFTVLLFAITIIAYFVELSQFYFDFSLLVRLREKSEVPTSDICNKNVLTSPLTPKNSKNSANTVYSIPTAKIMLGQVSMQKKKNSSVHYFSQK